MEKTLDLEGNNEFVLRKIKLPEENRLLISIHETYDLEYGFSRDHQEYIQLAEYLTRYSDIYHPMVLEKDGIPSGYIRAYDRLSTSSCGVVLMLDLVYVFPDHRKLGYGKILMAKFIEFAKKSGARRIDLLTDLDNPAAVKIYQQLGFKGRERFQMVYFLTAQPDLLSYLDRKINKS